MAQMRGGRTSSSRFEETANEYQLLGIALANEERTCDYPQISENPLFFDGCNAFCKYVEVNLSTTITNTTFGPCDSLGHQALENVIRIPSVHLLPTRTFSHQQTKELVGRTSSYPEDDCFDIGKSLEVLNERRPLRARL